MSQEYEWRESQAVNDGTIGIEVVGEVTLDQWVRTLSALRDLLKVIQEEVNPGSPPIRWRIIEDKGVSAEGEGT